MNDEVVFDRKPASLVPHGAIDDIDPVVQPAPAQPRVGRQILDPSGRVAPHLVSPLAACFRFEPERRIRAAASQSPLDVRNRASRAHRNAVSREEDRARGLMYEIANL